MDSGWAHRSCVGVYNAIIRAPIYLAQPREDGRCVCPVSASALPSVAPRHVERAVCAAGLLGVVLSAACEAVARGSSLSSTTPKTSPGWQPSGTMAVRTLPPAVSTPRASPGRTPAGTVAYTTSCVPGASLGAAAPGSADDGEGEPAFEVLAEPLASSCSCSTVHQITRRRQRRSAKDGRCGRCGEMTRLLLGTPARQLPQQLEGDRAGGLGVGHFQQPVHLLGSGRRGGSVSGWVRGRIGGGRVERGATRGDDWRRARRERGHARG